jgi:hypothetical protein
VIKLNGKVKMLLTKDALERQNNFLILKIVALGEKVGVI